MVGGTVFDRATQTGEGGADLEGCAIAPALQRRVGGDLPIASRAARQESLPRHDLELRRAGRIPASLQPSRSTEFVVRPEQTWVLTENGPNVLRIYTTGGSTWRISGRPTPAIRSVTGKATRSSSRPWR